MCPFCLVAFFKDIFAEKPYFRTALFSKLFTCVKRRFLRARITWRAGNAERDRRIFHFVWASLFPALEYVEISISCCSFLVLVSYLLAKLGRSKGIFNRTGLLASSPGALAVRLAHWLQPYKHCHWIFKLDWTLPL